MAHFYTYIGADYPPDMGILLSGINVALFPLTMSDIEVKLLLDQFPHLRRHWLYDGSFNPQLPDSNVCDDDELKELFVALTAQMPKLNFL
jgi:hypothetical protein